MLEASGPASATNHPVPRSGLPKAGRITAAEISMIYEAGAFPGSPVGEGAMSGTAAYKIDNILIDGSDVVCNKPKVAAYRAPGTPAAAYAVESVLDELAGNGSTWTRSTSGRRTSPGKGDRLPNGLPQPQHGGEHVIDAMKRHPHYQSDLGGPNRGRGIALGYWKNASMQSCATMNVNSDGTVSLVTGSVDIGGTRAAVAMQAAEALGLAATDVHPARHRHGLRGLDGPHRRQPDGGRYGARRAPRGGGGERRNGGPRRPALGGGGRRRRLRQRRVRLHQGRGPADRLEGVGGATPAPGRPDLCLVGSPPREGGPG